MTLRIASTALAALLLTACASTPPGTPVQMTTPPGPARVGDFRPTGEVRSSIGKSAAFDAWRVLGPNVDLSYVAADGSWTGSAGELERGFKLTVKDGQLQGAGVNVSITRETDGTVVIGGMYFQQRYLLRLAGGRLTGTTRGGRCSFELAAVSPGLYQGDIACAGALEKMYIQLLGEAQRTDAPVLPQVALALIAVLP